MLENFPEITSLEDALVAVDPERKFEEVDIPEYHLRWDSFPDEEVTSK